MQSYNLYSSVYRFFSAPALRNGIECEEMNMKRHFVSLNTFERARVSKHRDSYADQPRPFELGGLSGYSVTACDCLSRHDLGAKMPEKSDL